MDARKLIKAEALIATRGRRIVALSKTVDEQRDRILDLEDLLRKAHEPLAECIDDFYVSELVKTIAVSRKSDLAVPETNGGKMTISFR